jgi:hypothetical protein
VTQLIIVAKGKVITEGEKESWDSNAITPVRRLWTFGVLATVLGLGEDER